MNKETLNSISRRQIPERVKNLNDLAKKYNFHFSVDLIL
jgi:coproporphyrinogen III oxidase-like Fe-S oxidoreductase